MPGGSDGENSKRGDAYFPTAMTTGFCRSTTLDDVGDLWYCCLVANHYDDHEALGSSGLVLRSWRREGHSATGPVGVPSAPEEPPSQPAPEGAAPVGVPPAGPVRTSVGAP